MKVLGICQLIFICVLFRASDAEKHITDENCKTNFASCPVNETCSISCEGDCIKNEEIIFGTTFYPYFSPVCRSAVHDFRLSMWNSEKRSVTFKQVDSKCVFLGSNRMGISSFALDYHIDPEVEKCTVSSETYQFISDYISEGISHIASLHTNYLFGENDMHKQYCFIAKNETNIKFGLYVRISNEIQTPIHTFIDGVNSFEVNWTGASEVNGMLNAGYHCFLENKTLSTLTSIAFRKDAYLFPANSRLTITVNLHEEVHLKMSEKEVCKGHFIWKKNGHHSFVAVSYNDSQTYITFPSVEVGHSGIYSLECNNSDISRAGFVQLIVRACPKGKYGNFCTENCPACLNGGICHDLNGKCICPPGFDGQYCGKVCPPGSFGKGCKLSCNLNSTSIDKPPCKNALICLPHPYGCSCAPGFKGIFCNETCEAGTYGAGCSEKCTCRCAFGGYCNTYSGSCDGECATKWYGEQSSYSIMEVIELSYDIVSSSTVNLTWISPSGLDSQAHVQYYEIEFQRIGWSYNCNISEAEELSQNTTNTTFMLNNLEPSAIYRVNVFAYTIYYTISDFIGNKTSGIIFETPPTIPPQPADFQAMLSTPSTLFLVWSSGFPTGGLLNYYEIIYKNQKTNSMYAETLNDTSEGECRNGNSEYCYAIRGLTPNRGYEIQLIAFNKNVSNGSEAATITAKTAPSDFQISFLWQEKNEVSIKILLGNANSSFYRAFFIIVALDDYYSSKQIDLSSDIRNKSRCLYKKNIVPSAHIAAEIHNIPKKGMNFTIGNKSCVNGYYNRPLKRGKSYKIGVVAMISFCSEDFYSDIVFADKAVYIEPLKTAAHSAPISIILGFLLPLLIIVGIFLVLLYLWKSKRYNLPIMKRKFIPKKGSTESVFGVCNEALDEMEIIETESLCEELSNCIPLDELHDFIKHGVRNNKIKKEFLSLPKGQLYPCSVAKLPDSKYKNRYGNILPYDHSRVKLDVADGPDYIHANYIDGYKQTQKYIATQGPMYNTIIDFWSMVWKEKVSKIIMIANVMENGKCKCEKYWPDGVTSYGDIKLSLEIEESFADFVVRTFSVTKDGKNREIKHFHFVSWPDHDIPLNTTPFINFLRRVRTYNSKCSSPIVIHCSAGIGRTGTVILFENAFQMGIQENQVDVLGQLCCMRKQRMNIVENSDQYIFVYNALEEALCIGNTSVACRNFLKEYSKLIKIDEETGTSTIEKQYQMLNDFRRQLMSKDIHSAYMVTNQSKNRSMYILPSDKARPLLGIDCYDSDYINAVFIDSYIKKDAYVATQYPLPETVLDFWRMIFTLKSRIIILLQNIPFSDTENPRFWPEDGSQHYGKFLVKFESVTEKSNIIVTNLCVNDIEAEEQNLQLSIKLLQIKSWPVECELPSNISSILEADKFINTCESEFTKNVITITCLDGVTACGILCAFLHSLDQMKVEQDVNIFQSVKCTRTNRTQFITSVVQYKFLFDLIKASLESVLATDWI